MINDQGVIIERIFNAPRELVWQAWTNPDLVEKWWGPAGFTAPSAKADLRVGGKYVYAMHGPAGSEWDKDMYSAGVYKEIIPMEKLVVTDYFSDEQGNKISPTQDGMDANFPTEMEVTVTFEEVEGGKTKLTIFYPKPENEAHFQAMLKSGMEEGWGTSLDKFAKVVEQN